MYKKIVLASMVLGASSYLLSADYPQANTPNQVVTFVELERNGLWGEYRMLAEFVERHRIRDSASAVFAATHGEVIPASDVKRFNDFQRFPLVEIVWLRYISLEEYLMNPENSPKPCTLRPKLEDFRRAALPVLPVQAIVLPAYIVTPVVQATTPSAPVTVQTPAAGQASVPPVIFPTGHYVDWGMVCRTNGQRGITAIYSNTNH